MRVRIWLYSGLTAFAFLFVLWVMGGALILSPILDSKLDHSIKHLIISNVLKFLYGGSTLALCYQIYRRLHENWFTNYRECSTEPAIQISIAEDDP